jgi:hypothetical protein
MFPSTSRDSGGRDVSSTFRPVVPSLKPSRRKPETRFLRRWAPPTLSWDLVFVQLGRSFVTSSAAARSYSVMSPKMRVMGRLWRCDSWIPPLPLDSYQFSRRSGSSRCASE